MPNGRSLRGLCVPGTTPSSGVCRLLKSIPCVISGARFGSPSWASDRAFGLCSAISSRRT